MLRIATTTLAWLRNPYAVLDERIARGEFTFFMPLAGLGRVLVTGEPALIDAATLHPGLVGGRGTRVLRPVVGERAMIVLEGARHRRHREFAAPFFARHAAAARERLLDEAVAYRLGRIGRGERVSALEVFHEINLAVVVQMVAGRGAAAVRLVPLVDAYSRVFDRSWALFLRRVPLAGAAAWGRFRRLRAALRAALGELLASPPPETIAAAAAERVACGDFEPDEAIDELVEILLFGHDTAAAALAWWAAHLFRDGARLGRAREEARAAGDAAFVDATIEEAMRLSPPVVHLTRVAAEDTTLDALDLRRGTHVFPCMYLAGRHPAHFERAAEYRPERFLDAAARPPESAHLPLGAGSRVCVGKPFAKLQMARVARGLLAAGTFAFGGTPPLRARRKTVIMVPADGVPLVREV